PSPIGGPNPTFACGNSWRTAVASTSAEEWRNTSSAWGSLSVRIVTVEPSGTGRARSRMSPFRRNARAAFASPGPIAFARSAPLEPAGRRFSLPSGSVTRISGGIRSVGGLTGRRGRARQGRHVPPIAEVKRHRKRDHRGDREPTHEAACRKDDRFVGHLDGILAQTEGWRRFGRLGEVGEVRGGRARSRLNLLQPPEPPLTSPILPYYKECRRPASSFRPNTSHRPSSARCTGV